MSYALKENFQILFSKFKSSLKSFLCFFFLLFHAGLLKFTRSQKSKPQLVFNGFIYNKKITYSNGNTNWRCADFIKHKCFASCLTKNNQIIRRRLDHKHAPPTAKLLMRKLYPSEQSLPLT